MRLAGRLFVPVLKVYFFYKFLIFFASLVGISLWLCYLYLALMVLDIVAGILIKWAYEREEQQNG